MVVRFSNKDYATPSGVATPLTWAKALVTEGLAWVTDDEALQETMKLLFLWRLDLHIYTVSYVLVVLNYLIETLAAPRCSTMYPGAVLRGFPRFLETTQLFVIKQNSYLKLCKIAFIIKITSHYNKIILNSSPAYVKHAKRL